MPQGAVSNVGDSKFLSRLNETIGFMESLKGGILSLKSIDFGNFKRNVSPKRTSVIHSNSLELARRRVAAEHSESPMYFVFPAFRISSRVVIDSSRGVSDTVRKRTTLCRFVWLTYLGQSDGDSRGQGQSQDARWFLRCMS